MSRDIGHWEYDAPREPQYVVFSSLGAALDCIKRAHSYTADWQADKTLDSLWWACNDDDSVVVRCEAHGVIHRAASLRTGSIAR